MTMRISLAVLPFNPCGLPTKPIIFICDPLFLKTLVVAAWAGPSDTSRLFRLLYCHNPFDAMDSVFDLVGRHEQYRVW
jgi:hypothetical protein